MAPYQCVIEDGESGSRHVIKLAAKGDSAALLEAEEIWRRFCPSWCRSIGVWRGGEILATHGGPHGNPIGNPIANSIGKPIAKPGPTARAGSGAVSD